MNMLLQIIKHTFGLKQEEENRSCLFNKPIGLRNIHMEPVVLATTFQPIQVSCFLFAVGLKS